jgi:hypothetical protein
MVRIFMQVSGSMQQSNPLFPQIGLGSKRPQMNGIT